MPLWAPNLLIQSVEKMKGMFIEDSADRITIEIILQRIVQSLSSNRWWLGFSNYIQR